jgi:hypothetical protein
VVCLDSGCGNYDQLWCTTSLRGLAGGNLRVDVLDEGVHSGDASGIVPSSFRVLRQLLARIEDIETGRVTLDALHVAIPQERIEQAKKAGLTGKDNWKNYPRAMLRARCIAEGVRAVYPAAIGGMLVAEEAQDMPAPAKHMGAAVETAAAPSSLVDKATELGLRFDGRTGDKRLAALIEDALKVG